MPREGITGPKKGARRLVEGHGGEAGGSEHVGPLPPWALFLHP